LFGFLIKSNAGKINKVKQNNNKVKYVCAKNSPRRSLLSSPATAPEKVLLLGDGARKDCGV
jgi:hypothetical protein